MWNRFKKEYPPVGSAIYVKYGNGTIKKMDVISKNWIQGDSNVDASTLLSGMKEWISESEYEKEFNNTTNEVTPPKGVCRICGCTWDNACHNPEHGSCWWVDETETLCSHCYENDIKNDPRTIHPNKK